MKIVIVGPDAHGLGPELEKHGTVTRISGMATGSTLASAGIADADLFVLTDAEQATAIPVARDLNRTLRVIVYTTGKLPDFARPQADFIVDPRLLDPKLVASEIV